MRVFLFRSSKQGTRSACYGCSLLLLLSILSSSDYVRKCVSVHADTTFGSSTSIDECPAIDKREWVQTSSQHSSEFMKEANEKKREKHLYLTNTNRLRSAHTYSILNWLKFHLNRNCCCRAELVVHCSLNWIYEIYDQFIYYSHLTKSTTALLDVARYPLRCRCRWHGRSHTIIIHGA